MVTLWTDEYLNKLANDAVAAINIHTPFVFHRFYQAITSGTSIYTLPEKVKSIKRVTWQGKKLDPISFEDAKILYPWAFYVDGSTKKEQLGEPAYYFQHPTNRRDIRILPTPNQSFVATGGDPDLPVVGENRCTITCWRYTDNSSDLYNLPSYIYQRIVKAYVLHKAFAKEGAGQNLNASDYWKARFDLMLALFTNINSYCFVTKRPALRPGQPRNSRPGKPVLPTNFERVVFK